MVRTLFAVAVLAGTWAACGCTSEKSLESTDYATMTKTRVKAFVAEARRNPRTMAQSATVLQESLDAHAAAPTGDHKAVYEQLASKCRALADAAKKGPTSAETRKLLKELDDLAGQLPG